MVHIASQSLKVGLNISLRAERHDNSCKNVERRQSDNPRGDNEKKGDETQDGRVDIDVLAKTAKYACNLFVPSAAVESLHRVS